MVKDSVVRGSKQGSLDIPQESLIKTSTTNQIVGRALGNWCMSFKISAGSCLPTENSIIPSFEKSNVTGVLARGCRILWPLSTQLPAEEIIVVYPLSPSSNHPYQAERFILCFSIISFCSDLKDETSYGRIAFYAFFLHTPRIASLSCKIVHKGKMCRERNHEQPTGFCRSEVIFLNGARVALTGGNLG